MAATQYIKNGYDKLWDLLEAHAAFIGSVSVGNRIDWTTGTALVKKYGKGPKAPADFPEFEIGLGAIEDTGYLLTRNYGMRNAASAASSLVWTARLTQIYALTIRTEERKLTTLQLLLHEAMTAIRKGNPKLGLAYVESWGPMTGEIDLYAVDPDDERKRRPTVTLNVPVVFQLSGADLIT